MDVLNIDLFSSQPCENIFRIARSLSDPYSTMTNFSVQSFLHTCEKISTINSAKTEETLNDVSHLKFPHYYTSNRQINDYSNKSLTQLNLTESDIIKIINNAFENAKDFVSLVDMDTFLLKKELFSLSSLSNCIRSILTKSSSKIVDYTKDNDSSDDDDDDNESNDLSDESNDLYTSDEQDDQMPIEDYDDVGNILTSNLPDVERQRFRGSRIYDVVNPKHADNYFPIRIGTTIKFIHKQTACWLLRNDKNSLSADRLLRVRAQQS